MTQLGRLILIENVISDCIREGIRQQSPYKGIFRKCRERIEQFGVLRGYLRHDADQTVPAAGQRKKVRLGRVSKEKQQSRGGPAAIA